MAAAYETFEEQLKSKVLDLGSLEERLLKLSADVGVDFCMLSAQVDRYAES
jgi:hypothetical protein